MKMRITVTWKSGAKVKLVRDISQPAGTAEDKYTVSEVIDIYLRSDYTQIRKITVKPYTPNITPAE